MTTIRDGIIRVNYFEAFSAVVAITSPDIAIAKANQGFMLIILIS